MQSATPEKVEEKWNSMNIALKRIIQNWERSGQGFGGFINEEDVCEVDEEGDSDDEDDDSSNGGKKASFGSLTERPPQSLELRRNFVDGRSTYLLYLWDMLCEHDLFQSSMQQLKEGIGSGNGNTEVPSVIHGKRKNDDDDSLGSSSKKSNNVMTQLGASITKHADSMLAVAKMAAVEQEKNRRDARLEQEKNRQEARANAIRARINSLRDVKRNMVIRMASVEVMANQAVMDALTHEIEGIEHEIGANTEELNGIAATTPVKSNRSPS